MAVTRNDVARLAGTSPAVVSYVLNGGPRGVAPATKARVLRAIDQLGYRPNRIAASLRTKQTMTIGLIVPDNTNPYFAELAKQIEDISFAAGYTLLLGNATDDAAREGAYLQAFLDRQVDGLILIPSHGTPASSMDIARSGTPWVVLDRMLDVGNIPAQVRSDNRMGGRLATEHLVAHGRHKIACISGPHEVRNTAERVIGWRDALNSAGLDRDAAPLREVPLDHLAAYRAAIEILRGHPDIDAFFVASDEQSLGVFRAIADLELACPDQVALVSFDGIEASLLTTPALSTIRQPVEALAQAAFDSLSAQRADGFTATEPVILPVELLARGSCGCPDLPYAATGLTGISVV